MPVYTGTVEQGNLIDTIISNCVDSGFYVAVPQAYRYVIFEDEQRHYGYSFPHCYYRRLNITEIEIFDTEGNNIASTPFAIYSTTNIPSDWESNKDKLVDGDTNTTAVSIGLDGWVSSQSIVFRTRFVIDLGEPRYISSISLSINGNYATGYQDHIARIYVTNSYIPEHVSNSFSNDGLNIIAKCRIRSNGLYTYASQVVSLISTKNNQTMLLGSKRDVSDTTILNIGYIELPLLANLGTFYGESRAVTYWHKVEQDYMIIVLGGHQYVSDATYTNVYYIGRAMTNTGKLTEGAMTISTMGYGTGRLYNEAGAYYSLYFSGISTVQSDIPWITLYRPLYKTLQNDLYYMPNDIFLAYVNKELILDREIITSRTGERYMFIKNYNTHGISFNGATWYNGFIPNTNPGDLFIVVKL